MTRAPHALAPALAALLLGALLVPAAAAAAPEPPPLRAAQCELSPQVDPCQPCFGLLPEPEEKFLCGRDCPVVEHLLCAQIPHPCVVIAFLPERPPGIGSHVALRCDHPDGIPVICRDAFQEECDYYGGKVCGQFQGSVCQALRGCPPGPVWACKLVVLLVSPVYRCYGAAPPISCPPA